jgi:hypothetical protein
MFPVAAVRPLLLLPERVSRRGDFVMGGEALAQLLLHEDVVQPSAVRVVERDGGIAGVVDPGREAAVVVAAVEGDRLVQDGVAVVGSQRQTKTRQAFWERCRIDFKPLGMG